jgi:hypothetical protein
LEACLGALHHDSYSRVITWDFGVDDALSGVVDAQHESLCHADIFILSLLLDAEQAQLSGWPINGVS